MTLISAQEGPVLVFEDAAGAASPTEGDAMSIERFLEIAVGAASALARAHDRRILHRDLRPAHLHVQAGGVFRLAGFGRGIALDEPGDHWPELPVTDDALPYAAPEAARRSDPYADERSDLYSLGVMFYELLTGRLPFTARTAAEWLHVHVAVQPPRPSHSRDVPTALEEIILKLLSKEPVDRYGSTSLLLADLVRCRTEWAKSGSIRQFRLGRDTRPKLALSERLFGRDAEMGALLDAVERVRRTGRSELVLISGPAGAGKSALVGAAQARSERADTAFAFGKSGQHLGDIPYAVVAQILQSLVDRLLSASRDELHRRRDLLLTTLAGHGQLVSELVPELELVLGRQPPVADLQADQAQRRVNAAILNTLQAFAQNDETLVVFLDDLQWVDDPTWTFFTFLLTENVRNILLIGSYRDGETARSAQLQALSSHMSGRSIPISELGLRPLSVGDVGTLIAVAAQCREDRVEPLACAVHGKTAGNPFFVGQLLQTLVDEHVFRFDEHGGGWTWDMSAVARHQSTDNVVDLMVRRLDRLPEEGREILRCLACVGSSCDEGLLARVLRADPGWIRAHAEGLRAAGLLTREATTYAFSHDRVLEAAYASSTPAARSAIHARIAVAMVEMWRAAPDDSPFAIANQVERARTDGLPAETTTSFAHLLLAAARRAKSAAALDQALGYLETMRRLLAETSWSDQYALTYQATALRCECLIIKAELGLAATEIDRLLENSRSAIDRAGAFQLKAALQTLRSDYESAITSVLTGLDALGVSLKRYPSPEDLSHTYHAIRSRVQGRGIASLVELPVATDQKLEAAMGLLVTCQASFFVEGGISFLHLAKIVELTLESGVTAASPYGLSWFGVYIAHHYDAYEDGLAFANVAVELIDRHGWEFSRAATLVAMDQVSVWTRPLTFALANAREAASAGVMSGDLGMACYAGNHIVSNLIFMGEPLSRVIDEAEGRLNLTRQIGFRDIELLLNSQIRFAERLGQGGGTLAPQADPGQDGSGENGVTPVSQPTLFWEWLYAGMSAAYLKDYREAALRLAMLKQLEWAIPAHINLADYHLFSALTAAQVEDASAGAADRIAKMDPHRERLGFWATLNPATFSNKLLMIDAEIARLRGVDVEAMQLYERSAAAAAAAGFIQEQALAHELAAAHCETSGLRTAARQHLRTAIECYRRWGAEEKVRRIEAEHPLLGAERREEPVPPRSGQAALDIAVWAAAARAFSEEIVLDQLIMKLMDSMIVHAGARYGMLILMHEDTPLIQATGRVVDGAIAVDIYQAEPTADAVPLALVNTVIRTKKTIVLDDADGEGSHAGALDLGGRSLRAAMCLPLLKQGRLVGILYLENDLASGVFTPGRTAALELLAPQAAISLEAARLYAELLEENARRRETERALRSARAELARTAHMTVLGGLAASIAHEINQPLTGVGSNAAAGQRWLRRATPEIGEALANLEAIQENAVRAADIVRALRSLAKQAPQKLGNVRIDDVIREVLNLISTELEAMQVTLDVRLAGTDVHVVGDRTQLQQVMFNLVTNAIEAMGSKDPAGRRLTVRSDCWDSKVTVHVHDTGDGIAPDVIGRIFEPLFTTKSSGMGMGLAICRSIMEAHGGTLSALPSPCGGTTFVFSLPVAAEM